MSSAKILIRFFRIFTIFIFTHSSFSLFWIFKNRKSIFKNLNKKNQKKLYNIENNIEEPKKEVPQYYSIQKFRNAPHLTYDRRFTDKCFGLRIKLLEKVRTASIKNKIKLFKKN